MHHFKNLTEREVKDITNDLYHGHSLRTSVTDDHFLEAHMAALELIRLAGFDLSDGDDFGADFKDTMQSLLVVVMVRCGQLAQRLNDGEIVLADSDDE